MTEAIAIVNYRSLPETSDLARREIGALVTKVLEQEPECGGITFLQDAADPTRFVLIERWPSQDIFLGPHMKQPHIQHFIQKAGAFLAGPPDISFWHATSDA